MYIYIYIYICILPTTLYKFLLQIAYNKFVKACFKQPY